MKILLFLLMFSPAIQGQSNPGLDAIKTALGAGDVETLASYMADNVEISIEDKEQVYPKTKAAEVLRTFFNSSKPKSFSQLHKGTSRESSDQYCIGNLTVSNGIYRVYLYLRVGESNVKIQEMRFDKE